MFKINKTALKQCNNKCLLKVHCSKVHLLINQKVMLCQVIPEMSDIGRSMLCKLAFPIRVGDYAVQSF